MKYPTLILVVVLAASILFTGPLPEAAAAQAADTPLLEGGPGAGGGYAPEGGPGSGGGYSLEGGPGAGGGYAPEGGPGAGGGY